MWFEVMVHEGVSISKCSCSLKMLGWIRVGSSGRLLVMAAARRENAIEFLTASLITHTLTTQSPR